jgi:hypothetical protein
MNDETPGAGQIPVRMIGQHRKRIQKYRRRIQRLHADQEVSGRLHDDFVVEVIGYFDVLREFRDSTALDDDDLPDISPLRSRLGEKATIVADAPGFFERGEEYKTVPAIREVPLDTILKLSHQLDDAAQKLGFGANAVESTPHTKTTHGDLEALLRARGQGDALDNLPGGSNGRSQ